MESEEKPTILKNFNDVAYAKHSNLSVGVQLMKMLVLVLESFSENT